MPAPAKVHELVALFRRNRDDYRAGKYNETQARREFIDPFFKALGWDVDNEQGYAEAYKEVVHEAAVRVAGKTKAPDYAFRIGGARKFFVEAKKPAVNIKDDIHPAYQLRRYAWSARLPLSILTDFEECAVYDCRSRPVKSDKAAHSRVLYYTFDQYIEKWDEIAAIFAPDAIRRGSFDQYVQSKKAKRGTAEVDNAFLADISGWRELLAGNIALRNDLKTRELNFAVQRTIDRLIFLRIAEDRGIERYGRLRDAAKGDDIYAELCRLFKLADQKYNSGLFHFQAEKGRDQESLDTLTLALQIDDKPLKAIIKNLYYPDSPFQFDMIPADILGQVYEQFLGKVIRLTAGGRAKIEDKPEVKKAGGVFYTPTYIVEYIVAQTVGRLLTGRKPGPNGSAAGLTILDPACGSGSFLIGAYQYLLDWHLAQYKQKPARWAKGRNPAVFQDQSGEWRLTIGERKRILLNNIYGVDIDQQAVEVTKLSLLLKVLEGENERLGQRQLLAERVLPDLSQNIKCGNSLIGPDFYDGQQLSLGLLDEEEMYRINVFDWREAFPQIMGWGGFDAVIGNPPWISLTGKFGNEIHTKGEIKYLINRYHGNTYMPNMYEYFVAKGLSLIKEKGFFSFVVPDRLGFNGQFVDLRKRILDETSIQSLVYKVPFPGITADTLVFVFSKGTLKQDHKIQVSEYGGTEIQLLQQTYSQHPTHIFEYFESVEMMRLIHKLESRPNTSELGQVSKTTSGFGGKSKLITESRISNSQIRTMKGDSIVRYNTRKKYWFEFTKKNITGRTTDQRKLGHVPKVLLRKTGDSIIATYDDSGDFPEQSLYFLFDNQTNLDYKYILGILNSRLLTYYYRARALTNKKSIAQVKKVDLDLLPIPVLNLFSESEKTIHDRMVQLVDSMLVLNNQLATARLAQEKTLLQRQISAADRQIDQLVYQLYALTPAEIAIVEG